MNFAEELAALNEAREALVARLRTQNESRGKHRAEDTTDADEEAAQLAADWEDHQRREAHLLQKYKAALGVT